MGGGYLFPSEMEEEMLRPPKVLDTCISVCTEEAENSPVSPKNKEEMFSAPEIFTSDDTIWVVNEEMVEDLKSLQHDYCNVMESAVENYSKAISNEALDSPPQTIIINNQHPIALMNSTLENPPELIPYETSGSLSQTVTTSNQSPSALMTSEGLQLELLNETSVDQASSKNSEVSLFQVMKIVSDKQELSFVEKVHLPEEQIIRLCNLIAPSAAKN